MNTAAKVEPKESPTIFSGESVLAIYEGRKTMTRRVIKWDGLPDVPPTERFCSKGEAAWQETCDPGYWIGCNEDGTAIFSRCPYGVVGDKLWVRETWGLVNERDKPWSVRNGILYRATDRRPYHDFRWRSPLFMPRWASRLTLEITGIRIERLQDISEGDACAEGFGSPVTRDCKVPKFILGWDKLNAKRGFEWAENSFVWVISFRRIDLARK